MPPESREPLNESQAASLSVNLPERPAVGLSYADQQNKELNAAVTRYRRAVEDASVFPLTDEAKLALRMIADMGPRHYEAISRKYEKIRVLVAACERNIATSQAALKKTSQELEELGKPFGLLEELMGRRTQITKTGVAEANRVVDLQNRKAAIEALASESVSIDFALAQLEQFASAAATIPYDFLAADKAYKNLNRRADKWEQGIDGLDQAVGMISKAIPWGPETYIVMKSVGGMLGGTSYQETMEKNVRQYLEIRLGKGARVALAGAEHHDEILPVLRESDKLAEVMPELVVLLEEAAPAAAEEAENNASFLTKKIMKGFITRKFPKLAATKGMIEDLVDGASVTDAAANNRRNLLRATKKNSPVVKQTTNVAVDAAADKLQTTDYKIEAFRKQMKAKLAESGLDPVLQAEIEQTLVETLQERLEAVGQQR